MSNIFTDPTLLNKGAAPPTKKGLGGATSIYESLSDFGELTFDVDPAIAVDPSTPAMTDFTVVGLVRHDKQEVSGNLINLSLTKTFSNPELIPVINGICIAGYLKQGETYTLSAAQPTYFQIAESPFLSREESYIDYIGESVTFEWNGQPDLYLFLYADDEGGTPLTPSEIQDYEIQLESGFSRTTYAAFTGPTPSIDNPSPIKDSSYFKLTSPSNYYDFDTPFTGGVVLAIDSGSGHWLKTGHYAKERITSLESSLGPLPYCDTLFGYYGLLEEASTPDFTFVPYCSHFEGLPLIAPNTYPPYLKPCVFVNFGIVTFITTHPTLAEFNAWLAANQVEVFYKTYHPKKARIYDTPPTVTQTHMTISAEPLYPEAADNFIPPIISAKVRRFIFN